MRQQTAARTAYLPATTCPCSAPCSLAHTAFRLPLCSDWNISEALSGLNTAIVLSGLMTALDVFAWLRSENKSVRPLGGTRLFVAGTVSFVMLLSLRAYLTEARMRDFWARG